MAERTPTVLTEGRERSDERPVGALLIAAGVVALVTLGLVVRFGLVPPPALDPVDASTRPSVSLAFSSYRDGDRGQCLDVVAPDGAVRELRCSTQGGPLLGWDERGILVYGYTSTFDALEVIDPVSGEVISSERFDPMRPSPRPTAPGVIVDRSGRTLTVRDEERRMLWEVDVPDGYHIQATAVDPASGKLAMLDSARRILVLAPGASAPSVWVEDSGARFGEIAWEGTTLTSD